jgi:hypothetical protein
LAIIAGHASGSSDRSRWFRKGHRFVMILFRTTSFDGRSAAFLDELATATVRPIVILADERRAPVDTGSFPKVSLTDEACQSIGLFTPKDFAWRCGDYGFYLARRQFPEVKSFWMVESDVRIGNPRDFFALADRSEEPDLLAARLAPADPSWWWHPTVSAADARPYRCFFPLVRLSSRAICVLERKRVRHSQQIARRILWPNDEAFVATTIVQAGLSSSDLKSLNKSLYDDQSFSYEHPIKAENFVSDSAGPKLYHPVLWGDDYADKVRRLKVGLAPKGLAERAIRNTVPVLNSIRPW